MVVTPLRPASGGEGFRDRLEASFQNRGLVHLPAGSSIPLLRHHLWLVIRGMVKLGSVTEQGDPLLLALVGPDEPFGESLSSQDALEAVTLVDSDLLCLPLSEASARPELALTLVQSLSHRCRQSEALVALLGLRLVEERIRGFLELIAQDYGHPCPQGLRLPFRLTHQDLASALNTTRVTVTRIIGQLRQEGWLAPDDHRHLVISHLPRRR
ncbi:MAG: Crp/Fnr family transcriptional regulator [Cyanobacteriota bacterium]